MKNTTNLLHEMSWSDVEKLDRKSTVILFPIGSTEQHGPQNPLGTDFMIPEYIAQTAARKSSKALCLPTLPIGVASHHRNFSGTLWTSRQTLEQLVKDVLNSVKYHGFLKVIAVNGHGGNTSSIMNAISDYADVEDMICTLFEWWKDTELIKSVFNISSAGHASAVETSTVWAVRPDLAKEDRLEGLTSAPEWGRKVGDLFIPSRTDQFTKTGIAGSLEGISIEKGFKILEKAVDKLLKAVEDLSVFS